MSEKSKRKEFTERQQLKSIREQSGLCYLCDKQLIGKIEFDHIINCETFLDDANSLNPDDMNNDDNCGACHGACHKHKSRIETGHRAKKNRQYKRYGGADGRGAVRGSRPTDKKKTQWQKQKFKKAPKGYNAWQKK